MAVQSKFTQTWNYYPCKVLKANDLAFGSTQNVVLSWSGLNSVTEGNLSILGQQICFFLNKLAGKFFGQSGTFTLAPEVLKTIQKVINLQSSEQNKNL
ncbi:MAG: hypothetical protein KG003_00150 [Bacteroidetes bacterium]|nr:hypothetical protein [Bacteroidota bacterium]